MNRFTVAAMGVLVLSLAGCSQATSFTAPTPAATFSPNSCPAALGKTRDVTAPLNHGTQLAETRPAPSTALICQYGSAFNQGPGPRHTLVQQTQLAAPAAKKLSDAAAAISVENSTNTAGCPNDTGNVTVIAFGYHNAPTVDLWWNTTGCQTIDNGAVQARQVANDSFGKFQATFDVVTRTQR
jgi:hypothetical protein